MSLRMVERFVNQIPWLPKNIKVKIRKNTIQFNPKDKVAKYDEKLYDKLADVIYGAKYYDLWLRESR